MSKGRIIIVAIVAVIAIVLGITVKVLSSVWVGHIPESYAYNAQLPKPSSAVAWTDMNSPLVQRALLSTIEEKRNELNLYQPPIGFCLSKITIEDGSFVMYVVEAEETVGKKDVPAILYIHGGGFYFPLTNDGLNHMAFLAGKLGVRVYVPDYRISIEHPFPASLLDCYESASYLRVHADDLGIDIRRLLVYGDSAGGCLAASLTQYLRDKGESLFCGQILIYPVTDDAIDYPSMQVYRDAVWSANANAHMWATYLKGGETELRKYAVPMEAADFSCLPDAYVEVAEMDILHDQGLAYADKLREGGVKVEIADIAGAYHGFDADLSNAFVQDVIDKRLQVMERMMGLE